MFDCELPTGHMIPGGSWTDPLVRLSSIESFHRCDKLLYFPPLAFLIPCPDALGQTVSISCNFQ